MSSLPPLLRGDIFVVKSTDGLLSRLIVIRQRIDSPDGEAEYNHAGIISSSDGETFESRRIIKRYDLYEQYVGKKILIFRPVAQTFVKDASVRRVINEYDGLRYPWWRILVHAISQPLARMLHASGIPVCSELCAFCLHLMGIWHKNFWGTTPDMLADAAHKWREFEVIFEGELPAREPQ